MSIHLERETEKLKRQILALGARVEENVNRAVRSIIERDEVAARKVIDIDAEVDNAEVEVEEECLKILALHQPVATDLRFIVSVLKINSDLERIDDLAVNMAERAILLCKVSTPDIPLDFAGMAEKTQAMFKKSMDSLVNWDAKLAREVCASDDEVDEMNREMYERIKGALKEFPNQINPLIHLLSASRHLERIADHATNIAEDVLYMIDGEIIRHKTEEF